MNTPIFINEPESIYYYNIHCWYNPKTGKPGSRWDYAKHDGKDRPELFTVMKRKPDTGIKAIYHGQARHPETKKIVLALWCGKKALNPEDKGWRSQIFEPDTTRPGHGYGDIKGTEDAVLILRNDKAGTLKIMVFPGMKKQAETLFQNWRNGGVSESIPNNKVKLNTLSVMNL